MTKLIKKAELMQVLEAVGEERLSVVSEATQIFGEPYRRIEINIALGEVLKPTFEEELKKFEKLRDEASKANKKWQKQRNKLAENCPHPPAYIKPYEWEYDHGYGWQTMYIGNYCSICNAKDAWKTGTFSPDKKCRVL